LRNRRSCGFFLRLLLFRALQLRLGLRFLIGGLLRLSLGLPPGLLGFCFGRGLGPSRLFRPARLFVPQGLPSRCACSCAACSACWLASFWGLGAAASGGCVGLA